MYRNLIAYLEGNFLDFFRVTVFKILKLDKDMLQSRKIRGGYLG